MTALVSVCIPALNHERYIARAIESVLAQTLSDVELVIVDDGSRDSTLEIAQSYGARYPERIRVRHHLGHSNRGISETINAATNLARGEFWMVMGSDDELLPTKLETQLRDLRESGAVWNHCSAFLIDSDGRALAGDIGRDFAREPDPVLRLIERNCLAALTPLVRRATVVETGPWVPSLVYSDWEFWIRLSLVELPRFLPMALARYRLHATNTSHGITREREVACEHAVYEYLTQALAERLSRRQLRAVQLELALRAHLLGMAEGRGRALRAAVALATDPREMADELSGRLLASEARSPDAVWGDAIREGAQLASQRWPAMSVDRATTRLRSAVQLARARRAYARGRAIETHRELARGALSLWPSQFRLGAWTLALRAAVKRVVQRTRSVPAEQ